MGAVTVVVVGAGLEVDEVDEPRDTGRAQVVVPRGDAGVDDRDADATPVVSEIFANPGGADRGAGPLERALHAAIEADPGDARKRGKRFECRVRNLGDLAADERETTAQGAAQALDHSVRPDPWRQSEDDARAPAGRVSAIAKLGVEFRVGRM